MWYRLLADAVLVFHFGFVVFVVLGGLVVWRWRPAVLLHAPAALWGMLIQLNGWVCPLTPLENRLRILGGQAGYSGGFLEHYLLSILYPAGLTRHLQLLLGAGVVVVNLWVYAYLFRRRGKSAQRRVAAT
jgi:hypothetical protein